MGNSIIQMTVQTAAEAGSSLPGWCHSGWDAPRQLLCFAERLTEPLSPGQILSGSKVLIVGHNQEIRQMWAVHCTGFPRDRKWDSTPAVWVRTTGNLYKHQLLARLTHRVSESSKRAAGCELSTTWGRANLPPVSKLWSSVYCSCLFPADCWGRFWMWFWDLLILADTVQAL